MAVTNTYTVNGEVAKTIYGSSANIDLSSETGVKAGCRERPIPLLNKITVTSSDTGMSSSRTIYAGYKIVEQMLGAIVPAGSYNAKTPHLSTIISSGRFGIFEPALFNFASRSWVTNGLSCENIGSLINVGSGIKICVKIEYTKDNGSPATVYVEISGASNIFEPQKNTTVPYYSAIGAPDLPIPESVLSASIDSPSQRTWFESILSSDSLKVNLSNSITDPDTTRDMTITLMAYYGSIPTENNTFTILPKSVGATTSIIVPFENYEPTITIFNQDNIDNPDWYEDGYGSVADYDQSTTSDTIINVDIVPPA